MTCWFPLRQMIVGRRVADQEDGDGGEADVRHQVLVVAGLRADLEIFLLFLIMNISNCTHIEDHQDADELCKTEGNSKLERCKS